MGYLPNSVAGSLKSQRTNLVAAVIPSISHQFLAAMIQGISDVLAEGGFHLALGTSGESLVGEEKVVQTFLTQRPRAMLLHNTAHTDQCRELLLLSGVPVIETGDLPAEPLDSAVGYSNFEAARSMTEYLIGRGYKRTAFVGRAAGFNERTGERLRGYRTAVAEAGLEVREDLIFEATPGIHSGAQVISQLVTSRSDIQAVFFAGDNMAAGAILECNLQGWDVPGKIAIAGYDDSELATKLKPSLTALRVPRYEIGCAIARTALRKMAGEQVERRIDLGYEICKREST